MDNANNGSSQGNISRHSLLNLGYLLAFSMHLEGEN